ncbi:hypothetical protein RHSIM_RhsimUnG0037700 [Rhododendron simsii]|uniref:WAT1-related protein n=1 Tax=Rhododendron simsii TaxID=118357 RepID=A0A834FXI5_RHOSS|nr:hypothetical protein RHSIM_RhsimUnG0037700 [Rhododendron simsii]
MEGDLLPFLTMVIVEVGYAGMNIISKLAMDFGMNPFVHVAYRQLFATAIIAPLAFFLERQTRPMMTRAIFFQIFLFSIFGLESVGIRKKAGQAKVLGTVVCVGGAMLLSFYQGSIVMGGSSIHWKYANNMGKGNSSSTTNDKKFMLGPFLLIASNFSWGAWLIIQTFADHPIVVELFYLSYIKYFTYTYEDYSQHLEAKIGRNYSAPYTTSALICSMASIESGIIGISVVRDLSAWSSCTALAIHPFSRMNSPLTIGDEVRHRSGEAEEGKINKIISGNSVYCTSILPHRVVCQEKRSSVCVNVQSTLAHCCGNSQLDASTREIICWNVRIKLLFQFFPLESYQQVPTCCFVVNYSVVFYVSIVGLVLIVMGLYTVIWGKKRETKVMSNGGDEREENPEVKGDQEMQCSELQNGSLQTKRREEVGLQISVA